MAKSTIKNFTHSIGQKLKKDPENQIYQDVLLKNETKANLFISKILLVILAVFLIILFIVINLQESSGNAFDWLFVNYEDKFFVLKIILGVILMAVPRLLCKYVHKNTWIIKYVAPVILVSFAIVLCQFSTEASLLYSLLPVIASTVYADRRFTTKISVLSSFVFIADFAKKWMFFYDVGAYTDYETFIQSIRQAGFVLSIKLLVYIALAFICVYISGQVRNMVIEQNNAYLARMANEKIHADIEFAHTIQQNILPVSDSLISYSDKFTVDASMNPANGVGGDLYDFFMVDENHVAIVVADVSGKGLPAAMFMMSAKSIIKDATILNNDTGENLTTVNKKLCERNQSHLFITAWLGILDINTGQLSYSNAGHNPPLLCTDGNFEYLRSKPGLVLALMNNMKYVANEIYIKPGDMIYLYTDGVTEAINPKEEEYGEERLKNYLNEHKNENLSDIIKGVKYDVDIFSDGEEQFDDMTMLILKFNNTQQKENTMDKYNSFLAEMNSLEKVREALLKDLTENNVPEEICDLIFLALEEVCVNIINYAYQDKNGKENCFWFDCSIKNNTVTLTLTDKGIPFNPLEKADPDITANTEKRQIGGLGIFMTKKIMDKVSYEYKDNMNCLTLTKSF